MNKLHGAAVVFLIFLVMLLLFVISVNGIDLIFKEIVYQCILVAVSTGTILTGLNMYVLLAHRKYRVYEHKRKESNIREYHRYHRLLESPVMNT